MSAKKIYNTIIKKEPMTEGWSEDKKYCVTTSEGERYLLRISPISLYKTKKTLFSTMKKIAALDIPMCLPIEFGTCDDGVYCIQSWIDGEDLKNVLPTLSETEQYSLGVQAGEMAKKIHSIPITETSANNIGVEGWAEKYNHEIDRKIKEYHECGLSFKGDGYVLDYIEKNRHLLINRPQCFLIWDYSIMNMMYENENIKIIDFEYYNTGDPWNEFCCIVWSALASPHFATGQIRGYFDGEPPLKFFELLILYNAVLLLSLLSSWAITSDFGREVTLNYSQNLLKWQDNMNNPIPTWYLEKQVKK